VTKMVVMKPFMSDEGMLATGTIVDGSKFRNTRNLVNARYLRPADDMVPESPAPGDKEPVMPPSAPKADIAVTQSGEKVAVDSEEDKNPVVEAPKPKRRTRKKTDEA
jgi:hypothetical protein